jgi:hypothetical protein
VADDKKSFLAKAPEWFLAVAALIYATGFLVVFTFFAALGIREAGTEFFKVKYVHVGILCLIIPVLVGMPTYSFFYLLSRNTHKDEDARRVAELFAYLPSGILTLNMFVAFYLFAMFYSPTYQPTSRYTIAIIFVATIIGLGAIQAIQGFEFFIGEQPGSNSQVSVPSHAIRSLIRWVLCFIVIGPIDYYAFRGFRQDLWEMFSGNMRSAGGGYIFILFVLLIVSLLWRTNRGCRRFTDEKLKMATWAAAFPFIFTAFYLSILSFATSVYPYIPAERGGGSYVNTSPVVLIFRTSPVGVPGDLMEEGLRSKPLLIIDETSSSIYVADPGYAGGPFEWRRRRRLPTVIGVKRDEVYSIEYNRPTTHE